MAKSLISLGEVHAEEEVQEAGVVAEGVKNGRHSDKDDGGRARFVGGFDSLERTIEISHCGADKSWLDRIHDDAFRRVRELPK